MEPQSPPVDPVAGDTNDESDDDTEVTATATDVTKVDDAKSGLTTKLAVVGGIIIIGGIAATKMRKRGV